MNKEDFKNRLKDDGYYYGEVRESAISASNINDIISGEFGLSTNDWAPHFEIGKYFHVQTLEVDKLDKFEIRDVERRYAGEEFLKQSEVDMCKAMKESHDSHIEARGVLYGPGVEDEVPSFTVIDGVLFIGKADIVNPMIGYIGDLKSTSNMMNFETSIKKWYQSQLWLYWKMFGKPTAYVVTDKKSLGTKVMYPQNYHYAGGKATVLEAIHIYKEQYPLHYQKNVELQQELGI